MDVEALRKLDKVLNSIPPKKVSTNVPGVGVVANSSGSKNIDNKITLETSVGKDTPDEGEIQEQTTLDKQDAQANKSGVATSSASESSTDGDDKSKNSTAAQAVVWTKYFDPKSAKFYYHNAQMNVTQWEAPSEGIIDTSFIAPVATAVGSSSSTAMPTASSQYAVRASFAASNGSFALPGEGTYWDKVGRPSDRAGRQMAAFFDVSDLERNREEAREKKARLQQSGVDWREYKEAKLQEKKKRRSEWLRDD